VQELFFGELQAPGGSSTKFTLNSYDKVNPTSSFGYHVQRKKKKKIEFVSSYESLLLSRFDFNSRSVASVSGSRSARHLNIMQSVIVTNGKRQIGVDSG